MKKNLKLKRVFDVPAKGDGQRILIDRIWPRGLSEEEVKADHWFREIAPTDVLRKWFNGDLRKWEEFRKRYTIELLGKREPVDRLKKLVEEVPSTFIYAAKDEEHNNAVVLKAFLERE